MGMSSSVMTARDLPRRGFTGAELEKMVATGVLQEDERLELIDGEIVLMSPKGNQHELLKAALLERWYRTKPAELMLIPETTLRLSKDTYLEPDVVVYRRSDGLANLNGETALLVVELADTSLAYDLGVKAKIYASFGVKELWVINAARLETRIHRDPSAVGYQTTVDIAGNALLIPLLVPDLTLMLTELDLR
jgi:Uma2 family endonuclease